MEFIQWETLASTAVGGTLCAAIARYFIVRALDDLKEISTQIIDISLKLSAIETRLHQLDRLEETTLTHNLKIADIEGRLKYERPQYFPGGKKKSREVLQKND